MRRKNLAKKSKSNSIKFKIFTIPMVIMVIVIALIASMVIYLTKSNLTMQLKADGFNLTRQISNNMTKNYEISDSLNENIDTQIKCLGNFINNGQATISNEYLTSLSKNFEAEEINIIGSDGKIVFSTQPNNIGVILKKDHIVFKFLNDNKDFLEEPIRKSVDSEKYYKYGYVKKSDGSVAQIGFSADRVHKLTDSLENQVLVDNVAKDKSIAYAIFIDKNLKIQAHSEHELIGKSSDDSGSKSAAVEGKDYSSTYMYKDTIPVYDIDVPVYKNGEHIGAVAVGISMVELNSTINKIIIIIIGISIICFIAFLVIMNKVSKGITKPLEILVNSSNSIANGDFTEDIVVNSNDELGILANSFKVMSENLRNAISSIKEQSQIITEMSSNLYDNSSEMTTTTNEVASSIHDIAEGSTHQAQNLVDSVGDMTTLSEEMESMYEKLTTVKNKSDATGQNAKDGKDSIDNLSESINSVNQAIETVSNKIGSLNESVSQIGKITEVIDSISSQTNLLALNAAIEAARAGEQGKSFSVVADEIRKLAEQSQTSTLQIQELINSITNESQELSSTAVNVKTSMNDQIQIVDIAIRNFNNMIDSIGTMSPLIEDTHVSIKRTNSNKEQVLSKIENITAVAEENTALSEEISASSEELLASTEEVTNFAKTLNEIADKLYVETEKFKV
ncbi:Methyl-accepting chemotaxis protein [Clostridium cavendishii DSM 21758]|uniref:Methyl-accepting chemotaxis protein n=1 Tax=Clostridium cavendishii DSM 21758 TaxID=1121302 RepID=A0A1M6BBY3_9CLOT|nr:methyl-accepting chemotaxis protein [Clostridium cavendishii]SHI46225.1 Methyl-accepting chemotaxis protein [Clostridium cavendishii DSM 21758]